MAMLLALRIQNFALIDQLELEFGTGLTVLTGETGAGKSILLDALGLALGGRAEGRLLRTGAQQASVTATDDHGTQTHRFDALVTDYSSVMFDYLHTGRPVLLS